MAPLPPNHLCLAYRAFDQTGVDDAVPITTIQGWGNTRQKLWSECFWNALTVELKFGVEKLWVDAVWNSKEKPNLGTWNLDPILEERAGFKLELIGPMIDSYFGEIGRGIAAKLG